MEMAEQIIANMYLQCKQVLDAMVAEVQQLPKGKMICRTARGHQYYYLQWRASKQEVCNQRVRDEEIEETKRKLARRESLQKNIEILQRHIARLEKEFPNFPTMTKRKQSASQKRGALPEKPYATLKGDFVRSKSEAIIANELYMGQIPYEYEKILLLPGHPHEFLPDFTICTPNQKKIIYWEHCGLIENEDYRRKWNWKSQAYEEAGISVWHKNLIVTYESKQDTLDIAEVCRYIELLQKQ